jgi:hypothetical protein
MKKALLILLLVSFSYLNSAAQGYNTQSGYVVTYEQDTIPGLIKDRADLSEKILFKPSNESRFKEYTPSEVAYFRYYGGHYNNGNYYYKAIDIPLQENQIQKRFLLCLVEGKLSLYQYEDLYYVRKELDSLIKLDKKDVMVSSTAKQVDRRYIGHLKHLTQDCASLQNNIERTAYKADALSRLVMAYNQCDHPSANTLVLKKGDARRVKAGVRVSTIVNKADYYVLGRDVFTHPFNSKVGYSAGFFFQFPFKNKLAFQPEMLITQKATSYLGKIMNYYEGQVDFNITYLQVPLSVYYTFPTYKLRPFVAAGGVFSYVLASDAYIRIGNNKSEIKLDSRETGYRLSTGLSYPVFNRRIVSLEYTHEKNFVSKSVVQIRVHMSSHNLSLRMNF